MKQLCKRILSSLLCLAMLLTLLPVGILAADASMIIHVSPSAADVQIGDVVEYTVTVQGSNIGAMQFDLVIPEGMTYVPNSASVPAGLSIAIGWLEADWTEATMRWTGFNDHSTDIAANTVILTFCCTVDDYGTYLVELRELLPYDKDYALMDASLTVDPVSAHDLADYVDNNDATCTQDGTKTGTCTQCGKTLSVPAPGSALGHALSQYISDGNATCIQDGTKTAACDRCGFTDTVTDEGSALGHGYTALKTEPTCTEGGYTTYTCTRCGDSYVADQVDATGHRYYKGVCTVCGLRNDSVFLDVKIVAEQFGCEEVRYTVYGHGAGITGMQFVPMIPEGMTYVANSAVIPAGLSNDLGWGSIDWNERYQRWSGYTDLPSDIPEGTALLTFVCRIDVPGTYEIGMDELLPFDEDYAEFGASLTVDAVSGHELGEFVYNNDETCTQDGTESAICSKCSDTVTRTVANTALGHAYGDYASNNDTTCTEDGTKTATCDRCGATDTVTDEGSALGHAFTQYFPDGNATCTGDGTKTATCDRCDATDTVADEGSALGHAYVAEKTEPTCTEHGFTTYTCTLCGATEKVIDEGSALGHAYAEEKTEPTCTEDGFTTYTCTLCGATDIVIDEGSALGHAYTAVKTEPTCTEQGFTTYTCTACGDSYVDDYVDAAGHLYEEGSCTVCGQPEDTTYMDVKIVAEQSGCEEVRYTVYGHASGITAVKFALKIPEGMTYVPNSAEIPADLQENLGWDNVNWNEHYLRWAGYTELPSEIAEDTVLLTFVCQIEAPGTYEIGLKTLTPYDENLEEFEASLTVDTVSGHEMGEFIYNNDATCTQDGTETAACTKCRYAVTQTTENSALGHVFDEYVSNHDATCTEDGTATATCGRCGETDTVADEGSAYGHSYEAVVTEATCETGGYTTYTCTVCGDEYVDDRVEALGHSYSGAVEEEPTVEKAGVLAVTCSGCGDVIREVLPTLTEQDYVFGIQSLPTCTADGALSYTWNNTAYGTYSFYVILPSRGHSFKDGACTICGTPDPDVAPTVVIPTLTLKAPSLEFKDTVRVNAFFTAENTDDVVEMGMITYSSKVDVWNVETAEHVIPGTTYDANTGRYMAVSQGIHAKYLCDTVYLAIYAKLSDGTYVYSKLAPYSPVQYAASQLKNSTDMKLKQLVVAMLNYGAEAQLYFGYNTGNLANASLTDEQKVLPEAYRSDMVGTVPGASAEKQGEFANNGGFSKRYPAISFEGALGINYFFTPNYVPVDGVTLYYWNEADFGAAEVLTAENATGSLKMEGTGEYRGDIQNISAKELSEAVYVAAVYSDGTTTWTSGVLGYSIGSYCSSQSAKGTTVASLAEATAVYGYHAKQYFS